MLTTGTLRCTYPNCQTTGGCKGACELKTAMNIGLLIENGLEQHLAARAVSQFEDKCQQLADAKADALRLHNDKMDLFEANVELRLALERIANDKDVSCLAGNPALWPSTIAKDALAARRKS